MWNTKESIQAAITQYQAQHAEAIRMLTELQTQALKLEGAIAALDQLLTNANAEEAEDANRGDAFEKDLTAEN